MNRYIKWLHHHHIFGFFHTFEYEYTTRATCIAFCEGWITFIATSIEWLSIHHLITGKDMCIFEIDIEFGACHATEEEHTFLEFISTRRSVWTEACNIYSNRSIFRNINIGSRIFGRYTLYMQIFLSSYVGIIQHRNKAIAIKIAIRIHIAYIHIIWCTRITTLISTWSCNVSGSIGSGRFSIHKEIVKESRTIIGKCLSQIHLMIGVIGIITTMISIFPAGVYSAIRDTCIDTCFFCIFQTQILTCTYQFYFRQYRIIVCDIVDSNHTIINNTTTNPFCIENDIAYFIHT